MTTPVQTSVTTLIFTCLALTAFAANSVLCRLALGEQSIDASSFTIIRLLSGVITLWIILLLRNRGRTMWQHGSWPAAAMLFLYAATFSFAYTTLDTGTGALILFGSVQLTMILFSVSRGDHLHLTEWSGILLAFLGFVYLVLPGISTPSLDGFILMTAAGVAWGVYTIIGRGSARPLVDTGSNFLRTVPFVLLLGLSTVRHIDMTARGVALAVLSGAVASGIGYAIWYRALAGLTTTRAAVLQLSVPVLAAAGGVLFMSEMVSLRLALSAMMILGGIALVVLGKAWYARKIIENT